MYNDMENLLNCLKSRLKWYEEATAIKEGEKDYIGVYDFPDGTTDVWAGAIKELENTIDMLNDIIKRDK